MTSHDRIKIPPGFWTGLREIGFSVQDIAAKSQLTLAQIERPEGVATTQYFAIWQAYSELVGDISKAVVKLSTAYDTTQYPPSMLATYHARDYRDALKRMAKYKRLCPPESLHITEEGEECHIQLSWSDPQQSGPPMLVAITLATLLELGRRGTGQPINAKLVEFSFPFMEASALEAYFGCPVRFGADNNRLTLKRSDLDRPFLSYNEELLEILTPALERTLDERQSQFTIVQTVERIIKRDLAGSRPDMLIVARDLGMSERTLQRRLTEERTSFKKILSHVRHEMALIYLKDPALEIHEVAFLIGYEDQNSFYRAFRAWEGETPANWRVKQNGKSCSLAR
ncbi:helix-turn-helix transcriptional regulator [Paenibacillus sp. JDR-2]|uniref:helix-turn-helix transcriptional regulator n=1 Tax=Paenibacillus sp. (strain JDR-2) TaxID=324057 RepID=UPI0001666955|nr:AraC family transcriptional regulator [Paenibacillus sp. JDR-2]ACT01717.1 transcriptional regulator, AraC family [Paenibacillus sp. JDR-2]